MSQENIIVVHEGITMNFETFLDLSSFHPSDETLDYRLTTSEEVEHYLTIQNT